MTPETVCAVVVTYNRRELLIECLDALRNQTRPVDAVYLVDNASTDDTPELLLEKGYLDLVPETGEEAWERTLKRDDLVVHYLRLSHNQGGSGGFHQGVKRAYQQGYQWLWLMDDDARPQEDALEKLGEYFGAEVAALASLKLDLEGNVLFHHRGYFDFTDPNHLIGPLVLEELKDGNTLVIDHASFVGLLLSRNAVEQVGFPKEDFFLYYDDVEYCIHIQEAGGILLVKSSRIYHHIPQPSYTRKEFIGRKFDFVPFDALWLTYLDTGNYVWLNHKYTKSRWAFYRFLVEGYLYQFVWIVLAGDHKYRRVSLLTQAWIDGWRGNFDNFKPRKILYS